MPRKNNLVYLHAGHSSVEVLPSGSLKEIRRGYFTGSKITNPNNWITYSDWIQFANQLQIEYSYSLSWTTDQIWLAQWFRHETLRYKPQKCEKDINHICSRIFELRESFMKQPNNRIRSKLQYFETIYEKIFHEGNMDSYSIINANTLPKMMVQDKFGYLHSLYMCLETGALAIDSAKNVGTSFAELGIEPIAIFNREFGVYYKVL